MKLCKTLNSTFKYETKITIKWLQVSDSFVQTVYSKQFIHSETKEVTVFINGSLNHSLK